MDSEILRAVKTGNVLTVKEWLDKQRIISERDVSGRTLLHYAASNGKPEVIKCLLQRDADVLLTTDRNNTALHIAVKKQDDLMVETILENVARSKLKQLLDVKSRESGASALHVAAANNRYKSVLLLLKFGANFELTNNSGVKSLSQTSSKDIRILSSLIETSFEKARKGDKTLVDDLDLYNYETLSSVVNCTNDDGRTLMQVVLQNAHYRLASDLLWARVNPSTDREHRFLCDPERKGLVEQLARGARECRQFWEAQRETLEKYVESITPSQEPSQEPSTSTSAGTSAGTSTGSSTGSKIDKKDVAKIVSQVLEKYHQVLLAYREFDGKRKSLTTDPTMKTLEEVFQLLGFDPEVFLVIENQEACYYERLALGWKENVRSFMGLMDSTIDTSIDYYLGYIYAIQSFHAVKERNIGKIQELIHNNVFNHGIDNSNRTPLCYAAENGDTRIVRLLLESGSRVVRQTAESPVYIAASKGHADILELLLEKVDERDLHEFVDLCQENECTALHAAAKSGCVRCVKILLRYGATYWILDEENSTPLDLSTSMEVSDFLKLVTDCFRKARKADSELVCILEDLTPDAILAVVNARSREGRTLSEVATKAKAPHVTDAILRMAQEAKDKLEMFRETERMRL